MTSDQYWKQQQNNAAERGNYRQARIYRTRAQYSEMVRLYGDYAGFPDMQRGFWSVKRGR